MTRPADITEAARFEALAILFDPSDSHVASASQLVELIARALMAAEAREREACAVIAQGNARAGECRRLLVGCRDSEYGAMSARLSIAAAIRKRGEA